MPPFVAEIVSPPITKAGISSIKDRDSVSGKDHLMT